MRASFSERGANAIPLTALALLTLSRRPLPQARRGQRAAQHFAPCMPALIHSSAVLSGRRVHALGRIAHDVDDFGLVLLLVEAVGAVGGVLDALVAVAERHLHRAARAVVLDALEGRRDLVGGRLAAALVLLRLLPRHLQAEDRQRHLVGRIGRRRAVAVHVDLLEPLVQRVVGRERAVRRRGRRRWCRPASCRAAARSRIRPWCRRSGMRLARPRAPLWIDEAFEVAVPEAGVQRLRLRGQQRGDFRAVLAREQLREQLLVDLGLRRQHAHRADEVAPGVLAPGVVLVDAGEQRDVLLLGEQVARRGGVIHGRVRRRAEHVFARLLLEDARRAAVEIDGQRLELVGDRRHREAASRRDVADDRVDLVALHEVAEFGDDLRGRAGLVDVFGLDLGAAEARRCCRAPAPCRR